MVTIITEKLRIQRLDDIQFEPILQSSRWQSGRETTSHGAISDFTVYGKGGPTFTGRTAAETACLCNQSTTKSCHHGNCHSNPAPPKKRHCRSLSIPGDSRESWQPQASSVWRPVSAGRARCRASRNSPCSTKFKPVVSPMAVPLSPSEIVASPADTPSPVPRSASASSGFYDSSQGSLYTPWLDSCPSPGPTKLRHASGSALLAYCPDAPLTEASLPPSSLTDFCKARSYSMDEAGVAKLIPSSTSKTAISMPTLPHVAPSNPSSPWRNRVPRCRSQPCVLHERKVGMKRRRDDERPTLDFCKMKETAMSGGDLSRTERSHSFTCATRQRNVQFAPIETGWPRSKNQFSGPPESIVGLNTIASSPLDNPTLPPHMTQTSIQSVCNKITTASLATDADDVKVTADKCDDFSDSGCDDSNDEGVERGGFVDSENSCGCEKKEDGPFELEVTYDLDIDQIEQD